jgi:hypothetical protein
VRQVGYLQRLYRDARSAEHKIIVLFGVCGFPCSNTLYFKQTVTSAVLIQTNSPFISTLQEMTLLTSIRKVPIPNPLYKINI